MKAIVVFHEEEGHPLGWMLKDGFRHCFVCVLTGDYWVQIEQIKGVPKVTVLADANYDLAEFYRKSSYTVVECRQRVMKPSWINPFYGTLMVANCVGLVKSILCIDTFAWTPYALYKELIR